MMQELEQRRGISPEKNAGSELAGLDGLRLDFAQQPPTLEETRNLFLSKAMARKLHLFRPEGLSKKVFQRRIDIATRHILKHESVESIAQEKGKHVNWISQQVKEGLGMLWNNSPEELRNEFPREAILPTRWERQKTILEEKDREEKALVVKLRDPSLNKDQLEEVRQQIGGSPRFYKRYQKLFVRLERIVQQSGRPLPASKDFSPFAKKIEQHGGVVVFNYRTKNKQERVETHFLVLREDSNDAVEILQTTPSKDKNQNLPLTHRGTEIYRSF